MLPVKLGRVMFAPRWLGATPYVVMSSQPGKWKVPGGAA